MTSKLSKRLPVKSLETDELDKGFDNKEETDSIPSAEELAEKHAEEELSKTKFHSFICIFQILKMSSFNNTSNL